MITGIIGAMQEEVDTLKNEMEQVSVEVISGIEMIRGRLCGSEVVLAKCGIGKVFAALCAQTMILRYGVGRILNTGVGGTLTDRLSILDIALATSVVQHDMDTSAIGDPVGLISGINVIEIPASAEMVGKLSAIAADMGSHCVSGVIASGDQFISGREKKAWIAEQFGAIACEMEGAAIGQVCYVNGVDFAVIRAISDSASEEATMEYPVMVRLAAERSAALVRRFLQG